MRFPRLNWPLWAGFILSIIASLSFPLVFVWFPVTRDFPWANLLLFAIAIVLLLLGLRRAFARGRPKRSKVAGVVLATLGVVMCALFIAAAFVLARQLPSSRGAPQVGQKAPDFTLLDTNSRSTSLAELSSAPVNGKTPRGVLLVFYRGYW